MDAVLCSRLMLRPPSNPTFEFFHFSVSSLPTPSDSAKLTRSSRASIPCVTLCLQVLPVEPCRRAGLPQPAPFYLDKSYITKVKVSVRNYTAKLLRAKKGFQRAIST